jgi:hypothetical protein
MNPALISYHSSEKEGIGLTLVDMVGKVRAPGYKWKSGHVKRVQDGQSGRKIILFLC